ncbi:MAG: hypothetical protein AABX59_02510 [Nanoarchaeota archaeon]
MPFAAADDLRVTLVSYEPKPVVPGNFFVATFRIDNLADKNFTNIEIELDEDNKFFVEGSNTVEISSIEEGKSAQVTFNIGIRSSATSGFSSLDIKWDTPSDSGDETFSIQVKALETTLIVEGVESIPPEIEPGQEATVKITVSNRANLQLKDIRVKLNLDSAELPFAPKGGITERDINSLGARQSENIEFNIVTLSSADSQVYKVPLSISYFDEFGSSYKIQDVIALVVGSKPLLQITLDEAALISGKKSQITFKVINTGLTDAKFLNLELLPSTDLAIVSSQSVYVGDVDSDDFEDVEFELIPRTNGALNIQILLTYRDANNKAYSEIIEVPAISYSEQEAKNLGLINTNYTLVIIILVIASIILFFTWRRFKSRK